MGLLPWAACGATTHLPDSRWNIEWSPISIQMDLSCVWVPISPSVRWVGRESLSYTALEPSHTCSSTSAGCESRQKVLSSQR